MNCACPQAGYCPAFGRQQTPRQFQICRGEVLTPEACDAYRANWMGLAYANGHDPLACAHRGDIIDQRIQKVESKGCGTCHSRGETIPVYGCSLHGKCTLKPWNFGQVEAVCASCGDRNVLQPKLLARKRLAPEQLLPSEFQFNNSLLRFAGKLYMAYRVNWNDSRIAIAELDEAFNVVRNSWLHLRLGMAQEDPRLFVFKGELHVSFSAVYQKPPKGMWTDVCYARLEQCGEGFWHVADEYAPQYAGRAFWEKNWGFFEHEGELLCVYSIKPHKVLRIDGDRAELVAETKCEFPKKPGLFHGGAPPIFHRGEYYSFFHRRLGSSSDKWYTLDLYTFEARPPFRPSRHVELPLLVPTMTDRPGGAVPHAVFPGGAFIDDKHRWTVSFGYYDKWSELAWFGINDVEACLTPLPGGPMAGVAHRRGTNDLAIWKEVNCWNEYELPDQFSPDDVVVDIGAHIGAFSRACLERGAGYVISAEPLPASHNLLKQNLVYYQHQCDPIQIAVGDKVGRLSLFNPDHSGQGFSGVTGFRGGAALCDIDLHPLSYLLPDGPVRLLKIDAEGAEYDILEASDDLARVQEIVGEAHRIVRGGREWTIEDLASLLARRGFEVQSLATSEQTWLFRARRPA